MMVAPKAPLPEKYKDVIRGLYEQKTKLKGAAGS